MHWLRGALAEVAKPSWERYPRSRIGGVPYFRVLWKLRLVVEDLGVDVATRRKGVLSRDV